MDTVEKRRPVLQIIRSNNITNDWSVERIAKECPPYSWEEVFKSAELELKDISDILENDKKVNGRYYPDSKNLFKAFELTPLPKVKVVILGQDIYHGINPDGTPQAQGLAFSVKKGAKIPSSLINIYKELKSSVEGFQAPNHGCLENLCFQGILLLNQCLTVRPGVSDSHKEIWLSFIKKVINAILDANPNCIFVIWGRKTQKVQKMLGGRSIILEAPHPAMGHNTGFLGCNHFNKINEILKQQGKSSIDWNLS